MRTKSSAVVLLASSVAVVIGLGRFHERHNADSLLPILVSLQHWTPYFWGQDRFGMLVPLIAEPIRNPFFNLLAQAWLTTAAALLAPFLVARFLATDQEWFAAGALAAALLLLMPIRLQFDWFATQPYAVSISLAFGALLLSDKHIFAAIALMLVAHWVNVGVFIIVAPCLVLSQKPRRWIAIVTAFGIAGGWFLKHAFGAVSPTTTDVVPAAEWLHGWSTLLGGSFNSVAHPAWVALFAVVVAVVAATQWKKGDRAVMRAALGAMAIGVAYWLVVGSLRHVQANDYYPRYILPSILFLAVSAALVIVASIRGSTAAWAAAAALVLCALSSYGWPSSLSVVRKGIDRSLGTMTPDVIATNATVIAGDYWTVWPAVFHANMTLYERTSAAPVFGLAYRSNPTDRIWLSSRHAKPVVIIARRTDAFAADELARLAIPLTLVDQRGPFLLFEAR